MDITEVEVTRTALISPEYTEMNLSLHMKWPMYGSKGSKWADTVRTCGTQDILDYGCGKGSLGKALGFTIQEYDPAIPGKNIWPIPADLVVCTDVLEHIEPDKLDAVLVHLRYLIKKKGFFVIATRASKKTLRDGRNAHLIVQPREWWLERLKMFFEIELEDQLDGKGDDFAVIVS